MPVVGGTLVLRQNIRHSLPAPSFSPHNVLAHCDLGVVVRFELMEVSHMYVSITGLRPNGFFTSIIFCFYAIPSLRQARKANGLMHCEVKSIDGFHHTIAAW